MTIKGCLHNIRAIDGGSLTVKRKLIFILLFLALGMGLGLISKYVDGLRPNGRAGDLFQAFSDISSRIGIWVFIAVLIASWSRSPIAGAIHVFTFFAGLLLTYYIYSMILFGFFPAYYFLRWGLIALASPLGACIAWYGRGKGWAAALCAALPVSLLGAQGYGFIHTFAAVKDYGSIHTLAVATGFDFMAAIALFLILPAKYQHLKVLPLAVVVTFIIRHFEVLGYIIGGL